MMPSLSKAPIYGPCLRRSEWGWCAALIQIQIQIEAVQAYI